MNQPPQAKKLLDQYREALRLKRYSPRTEQTYTEWVKDYILYHNKRHPKEMNTPEIGQFLTHLTTERNVSASTQNQALSAILFLYRHILRIPLDETILAAYRPQRAKSIPTVLSKEEVKRLLASLTGTPKLIAQVMYGSGLRIMEAMRLRIKDIDFDNRQIIVRDGKGENDRFTTLPDSLHQPLRLHIQHIKLIHQKDLQDGFGTVHLPSAIAEKSPNASKEWIWQYLFPASDLSKDPRTGTTQRHHLNETVLQKAIKQAPAPQK